MAIHHECFISHVNSERGVCTRGKRGKGPIKTKGQMKFASFAKIKLMRLIKATLHNRCRGIPPNFHCITTNFTSFVQLGLFELKKLVESIFLKKKYLVCIFLKYISLNIRREYRADFEVILSSNANIFAPNPVPCTRFQQILHFLLPSSALSFVLASSIPLEE